METPKEKKVAFITGYSAEKIFCNNEDKNLLHVAYTELYRLLLELYKQGYTHYYSGMSEGVDMLAANAVLDFKDEHPDVRLVAVVPFKWQQERYSTTGKNDYKYICSEADEVVTLAEEFAGNNFYLRRNDYLVENCSTMVCYHDGQCDVMAQAYNRAEKAGIPIINIYERLSDYLSNDSEAKKILQLFSCVENFNYCKEGIMLGSLDDNPTIVPFECICKVDTSQDKLHITLQNGEVYEVSLF